MNRFLLPSLLVLLTTISLDLRARTWNTLNTNYGYIQLGPANSSWAHIYTDRPKFIFNKDVYAIGGGFSAYSSSNLFLKTNGTTRMTVKYSNGNVGIGSTNPLEKLHVNGNLLIPSDKILKFGTENSSTGHLTIHNASCCYNTYADIKGNLYFRTEGSEAILGIQKDATVTIGVWPKYDNTVANTDGHKLMVNGGVLCEKVKIIGDVPNSDHVFEKDYDLKSIEQVKEFVETNKHLPEVPSTKDFKENGYNVGEMDDLLLRKVEELTLYLIQLKEEMDLLKAESSELKQPVSK
jgi:hypothetical protein